MQINIDKKTGALLGVIAMLISIFLLTVLRPSGDNSDAGIHGNHSMGMNSSKTNNGYTGADIMFLQMMIPHHQQAIDISNLALKTSKDKELLDLAKIIIEVQSSEIAQMNAWLKDAGATTDPGHSMDGMGGMLNERELTDLSAASGKSFDTLWLKGMIEHHDGAVHMTTMIRDASNTEIQTFGENIVKDQTAQIKQMKEMLKRIG